MIKILAQRFLWLFSLERNSDEFGIDFQQVLSERIIPDSYKQKLETHFTNRGRKDPHRDASIYQRSLRLLLEYLNDSPQLESIRPSAVNSPHQISPLTLIPQIPRPTKESVTEYLEKWKQRSDYIEQEDALSLLFRKTYPTNTNLSEVLIKCSSLNDFYRTNIFSIYPIAKHIISLDIDSRLISGDPKLVNDISRGHGIKSTSGKELHLFSFATKYCSHHNQIDFPIFDSYVEKLLIHFRKADGFAVFRNNELRGDYLVFKNVIQNFREAYNLQDFNLKQIDQYLWQFGKDVFPKQYRKNEYSITPVSSAKE